MHWKPILAGLGAIAIAGGMWGYWHYNTLHPVTDDAYVEANIVSVASETTGKVVKVAVEENQHVKAGDLLFAVDDTLYANAVAQARATLAGAKAAGEGFAADVQAAQAEIDSAETARDTAMSQLDRVRQLFKDGHVAQSALDDAQSSAASARAAVDQARAGLAQARTNLASNGDDQQADAAALSTAQTNLDRTKTFAAVGGWVSNIDLREGTVVSADEPLFSLVEDKGAWVSANFKETDLDRIREGQPATVRLDMAPDEKITGHVQSIAHGSGSTFSLLPAENASGNWVKVTQRFPVRIALDGGDSADMAIRAGASAKVRIDTVADRQ
ncbi:MAG: secretion protein [Rhodobacteraceae bacterium]|nr:secretion protein [Paracoccaceae bacterium]